MPQTYETPTDLVYLPTVDLGVGDDFRLDDDLDALAELTASITEHGVLQPLLVRRLGDHWQVVAGRRRLEAARRAGLEEVPCVLRPLDDSAALDAALAENLHRRNLSPIEEALAFARLKEAGSSQRDIARRVGRSEGHVSLLLKLLDLPKHLQNRIHARKLSYRAVLDHPERYAKRTGKREGGVGGGPRKSPQGEGSAVLHWRRRHARLLSGLQVLARARPSSVSDFRVMIDKVLRLDAQPLKEELVEQEELKQRRRRFKGA